MLPYQRHQKLRAAPDNKTSSSFNLSSKGIPSGYGIKKTRQQAARQQKSNCCFNHIVGLPVKDKVEHPIYDYEKILYDYSNVITDSDSNFKDKHLWVKKATGLGVTEFMLRLMAWLCTKDDILGTVRCA